MVRLLVLFLIFVSITSVIGLRPEDSMARFLAVDDEEIADQEAQCVFSFFINEKGESDVVRGCYYEPEPEVTGNERCREIVGGNGTISSCTICKDSLCNAAIRNVGKIALIATSIISVMHFLHNL